MAIDYTSIDEVVNDFQLMIDDTSYDKEAHVYQLRLLALQGLRELTFDVSQEVRTLEIGVIQNSLKISLPGDYVKTLRIGFKGSDGNFHALGHNPNLSLDASVVAQANHNPSNDNDPNYRLDVGKKFGVGGGNNSLGYYRLNRNDNTINFSSNLAGKAIFMEYISDGISEVQATNHIIQLTFNSDGISNGSTVTIPSSTGGSLIYTFTTSTPTSPFEIYIEDGWSSSQISDAFINLVNDGYPDYEITPFSDDMTATPGGDASADIIYSGESDEVIDSLSEDTYSENTADPVVDDPVVGEEVVSGFFSGNQVGGLYGGGVIYYVFNSSDPDTEIIGSNTGDSALIISLDDIVVEGQDRFEWGEALLIPGLNTNDTSGALNDDPEYGVNSNGIEQQIILDFQESAEYINNYGSEITAAKACELYSAGGYNDWFLPNFRQFYKLNNKLPNWVAGVDSVYVTIDISNAEGFNYVPVTSTSSSNIYWLSSQINSAFARGVYLAPSPLVPSISSYIGKNHDAKVRAIRKVTIASGGGGGRSLDYPLSDQSLVSLGTPGVKPRVHKFCEEALRCYIYYKYVQRKRGIPANEKQMAKRAFFNEKRLARARMMSFSKETALQTSRKAFKQSPKF